MKNFDSAADRSLTLDVDTIRGFFDNDSQVAAIRITAELTPVGGELAPIAPPTFPAKQHSGDQGPRVMVETRWRGRGEDCRRVSTVVLDTIQSQANRLEDQLLRLVEDGRLELPAVALDLSGISNPGAHVRELMDDKGCISSLRFPHRNSDAYFRDADVVDDVRRRIYQGTAKDPDGLFEYFPQSLLFGFWNSFLPKEAGSHAKVARSITSEVVGYDPAADAGQFARKMGVRSDPLNLDGNAFEEQTTKGSKKVSSANLGHGSIPFSDTAYAGISFEEIEQQTILSVSGLRRIGRGSDARITARRALLAALGLTATAAWLQGPSLWLRSGCELVPTNVTWDAITPAGAIAIVPPTVQGMLQALACFRDEAGLKNVWAENSIMAAPKDALRKVIEAKFGDVIDQQAAAA